MAIATRTLTIQAPDGAMPAHLALPQGPGPHPAVVVIMEAFGLVPHIRDVANRLAGEGYVAIAPDFYYRHAPHNVFGYDELAPAVSMMKTVDDARFLQDMRATLATLRALPEVGPRAKLGVTGFCMGGRLTFHSACSLPQEFAAAAPFYGGGITGHLAQASALRAPLRLFFGERDAFIPLDEVKQIERQLKEVGADARVRVYPNAQHGFFCNERASYEPAAAAAAWRELLELFAAQLKA